MKTSKLYFRLELPFQSKLFNVLTRYGFRDYNKSKKCWYWYFPVKDIDDVLAVLGSPFKFSESDISKLGVKGYQVKVGPKQGKGFVKVKIHPSLPSYFQVTTVRDRKPQNTNVSYASVKALWRAILAQPIGKLTFTSTVAKNYCNELKITDFNVYTNGKFNWKYFSGSRQYYLKFYACLKVLEHFCVIEHVAKASKSGVIRKSDKWEFQSEI